MQYHLRPRDVSSIITISLGFSIQHKFGKGTPNHFVVLVSRIYDRRGKNVSTLPKVGGRIAASRELGRISECKRQTLLLLAA